MDGNKIIFIFIHHVQSIDLLRVIYMDTVKPFLTEPQSSFYVCNRQVFPTLRFYLKFGLYKILFYLGFGLDNFHCSTSRFINHYVLSSLVEKIMEGKIG